MSKAIQVLNHAAAIDLSQFRLIAEPTADAIANDIRKFYEVASRGVDMTLLGRFLLGVSLIKAKALVGNARRGMHGKGEGGWMNWKKTTFPDFSNNVLTDAVNFSQSVHEQWGKLPNFARANLSLEAFQMPENPEELKGLLSTIHDIMDGKQITAFCRGIGRIREAQRAGTYARKPRDLRKQIEDAGEVDEESCNELLTDMALLADAHNPELAGQKLAMLHKLERGSKAFLERVQALIKAKKSKS